MIIELGPRWPFVGGRRATLSGIDEAQARLERKLTAVRKQNQKLKQLAGRLAVNLRAAKLESRANKSASVAFSRYFSTVAQRQPQLASPGVARPTFPVTSGTVDGLPMIVPATDGASSLEHRVHDREAFRLEDVFLRRVMGRSGAYVDIGANVGLTCLPHAVLRDCSVIIAVEPEDRNFACLTYNVAVNGFADQVVCRHHAMGETMGSARLRVGGKSGAHFIDEARPAPGRAGARLHDVVPVWTVDRLVAECVPDSTAVQCVKSDTQGYEGHVLAGAPRLLARRQAVWQIELWPAGLARCGTDLRELSGLIERHFSFFVDARIPNRDLKPTTDFRPHIEYLTGRAFTDILLLP